MSISPLRKLFLGADYLFLTLVTMLSLFPLLHILAISLSSNAVAQAGLVTVFPVGFTLESYKFILGKKEFFTAFWVSVQRVLLGSTLSLLVTILSSYALSQPDHRFKARKFYSWAFIIPMVFSGGLIPIFMVIRMTGLYNSLWALVLPSAVQVFNVILMLNFFRGLPYALSESAFIDGAGHFTVLTRILLPISKPSLATVGLFTIVFHWNSWFDGMVFISQPAKYPLQTYLRNIIRSAASLTLDMSNIEMMKHISQKTLTAAQIFVAIIPILIIYPFLQRHFVSGMTIGSVKG